MASTENKLKTDSAALVEGDSVTSNTTGNEKSPAKSVEANGVPEVEEAAEVTKRSIRVQTWKKIQDKKCLAFRGTAFNRIPNFIGVDKAAALLIATDEFKNAKTIKVDIDRSQDVIKLEVLNAAKDLYISTGRETTALYAKVNCTADQDIETKKKAILVQYLSDYGTEIEFQNKVELDMLVFGSVAVSRTGQRIGRGNGYVDLDFGLLKHCGSITPKTIIVTVVHDEQVYDTLPTELFVNYDVPVDIIVTPTEVIRVAKPLPRPAGLQWNLLSQRRLDIITVLKAIKEAEEKTGKVIVLKEEDTDVESNRRPRTYRRLPRKPRKGGQRSSGTEGVDVNGTGSDEKASPSPRPRKRFFQKNRKSKKPVGGDGDKLRSEDDQDAEPTKRSLRLATWKKMNLKNCGVYADNIYNRIPNFNGAEEAAKLLTELDEYKKSTSIKVNSDRSQDPVKINAITDGKDLYYNALKESTGIFTKVTCAPDADAADKDKSFKPEQLKETGRDVPHDAAVPLDILVIGCVAVSRSGQRLGRGNGYVDLDYAILKHTGAITDSTIIVTTVHDEQVYDELPAELFAEYDVTVDVIVTPTQVIRVQPKPQRPAKGILWHLLSNRRLEIVPALKEIKAAEEAKGKVIVLKEEDTDVESKRRRNARPNRRRPMIGRNGDEILQTESTKSAGRKRSKVGGSRRKKALPVDNEQPRYSQKKRLGQFCIKVSNIPRAIRIKAFKTELRDLGCNPMFISWKGSHGLCFLHFGKPTGDVPLEQAIDQIVESLGNLQLKPAPNDEENGVTTDAATTPEVTATAGRATPATASDSVTAEPNAATQMKLKIEVVRRASFKDDEVVAAGAAVADAAAATVAVITPEARIQSIEVSAV